MSRSIPPPRFPKPSLAPPPLASPRVPTFQNFPAPPRAPTFDPELSSETMELEAVSDDVESLESIATMAIPAARMPRAFEVHDEGEELDDDLLEDEPTGGFGESAPTQTRPRIELPKPAESARRAEPWVERAEALLDAIERADKPQRMALHRELGALLIEHKDHAQAFEVLVSAFSEDVEDDATVDALERLARAHDRMGDLLRTTLAWSEDIEWMRDRPRLGALLVRIAKWYGEDVRKVDWAMPFAERAVRLLPDRDPRAHRQLARLHRRAKRFTEAEAATDAALARVKTAAMRSDVLLERARLREDRGDELPAVRAGFLEAFEADPTSEDALLALDAMCARENFALDRIAAWQRRVAAVRAPVALAAARLRLAELQQGAGDDAAAAVVLEELVTAEPDHKKALEMLLAVRRRLEDWAGLRQALERALDTAEAGSDRVAFLLDLASLLVEAFGDHDAAVARLEQVIEIDPSHQTAHKALAQLHRTRGRLHDLAFVLERHSDAASDRKERASLLVDAARIILEVGSADPAERERARVLCERAVALVPDSVDALDLLARLDLQRGDVVSAEESLKKALETAQDPAQRAELEFRRAQLRKDGGAEPGEIRELLHKALDLVPTHLGALAALRTLALAEGDPAAAARACAREIEATMLPARKVELLLELARIRSKELDDLEGAIGCWDEVLHIAPGNAEAATALIEPYAERSRWSDVHALASQLLSAGGGSRPDRARWHALHGRALKALGHAAEASASLAEAVRLDAQDVASVEALAEARFAAEEWDGAFQADQRLLLLIDPNELDRRLVVHHRMGRVQQEQGRTRGALASYQQALAIDPEHRPTLERLVEIHVERRTWNEVVDHKRRLFDITVDVDARCALLVEIADVHLQQTKNARAAVEVLEEAVDLRPRDLPLLHRLLDGYHRVEAWPQMVANLEKIADVDRNPTRRARVFNTLGQIHRDKRHDGVKAAEAFEKALDEDPTLLTAFESIDRIHTASKNWKGLERAYRRMLHRVAGRATKELEVELWNGLALVYRDRLKSDAAAIEAFRAASIAAPADPRFHRILAELHARNGRVDDAAAELHTAIAKNPLHAEPYRALFRLYRDAERYDRAWCLAAALVTLEKADDEIAAYHAHYASFTADRAPSFRGRLDAPSFTRFVRHPDQDVLVTKIFEMILPAVRASRANTLRTSIAPPANVRWEDRATSRVLLTHAFFGAAEVLGIEPPRLSLRPDREGGLVPVGTEPPSTVAGRQALMLKRHDEILFLVGHHLSSWRGDAHLKVLFPDIRALEALLLGALKLVKPDLPLPSNAEARASEDARTLARHLEPVQYEALRVVGKRFLEDRGKADLKAWSRGLELTAARAGLLLCGDVATAIRGFDPTQLAAVGVPASEVVRDLVSWFVSPEHLDLRERLGIGVDRRRM